jgi:hypothetical protein
MTSFGRQKSYPEQNPRGAKAVRFHRAIIAISSQQSNLRFCPPTGLGFREKSFRPQLP